MRLSSLGTTCKLVRCTLSSRFHSLGRSGCSCWNGLFLAPGGPLLCAIRQGAVNRFWTLSSLGSHSYWKGLCRSFWTLRTRLLCLVCWGRSDRFFGGCLCFFGGVIRLRWGTLSYLFRALGPMFYSLCLFLSFRFLLGADSNIFGGNRLGLEWN
jgi:hypothetical protein